jgi:hypothetical protein
LAVLLLERLPLRLGKQIVAILPSEAAKGEFDFVQGSKSAQDDSKCDLAIGYPDFVEQISHSFFASVKPSEKSSDEGLTEEYYRKIADAFLWAFAQEFSSEMKYQLSELLPVDLRSRMNLYVGGSDQSQVA